MNDSVKNNTRFFFFNVLKTVFFKYARVVFTERADVKC